MPTHRARSIAYNSLGNALKAKGKLDEAIEAYREAIKIDPCRDGSWSTIHVRVAAGAKLNRERGSNLCRPSRGTHVNVSPAGGSIQAQPRLA